MHSDLIAGGHRTRSASLSFASRPFVLVVACLVLSGAPALAAAPRAGSVPVPVVFVPNVGQLGDGVAFAAHAAPYTVRVARGRLTIVDPRDGDAALALAFLGASDAARVVPGRETPARVSYLLGADPARWRSGVPAYESVRTRDLWPGIELVLRSAGGRLKYEFVVAPGASADAIRLAYEGATDVRLDAGGALRVRTRRGVLTDERPVAYQDLDGRRVAVASRFVLRRERGAVVHGFAVGAYRPTAPLVIDPGLLYATYLGGAGGEHAYGIAADAAGDVYVTGRVDSAASAEPGGSVVGPGGRGDVLVAKIRPSATGAASLLYLTYLGGGDADVGRAIAVDGQGQAHVTGQTASANFPVTGGAFSTKAGGRADAFVAKLAAAGTSLVYSTFLGGGGPDEGRGIALGCPAAPDAGACEAYVTGWTQSSNFPITPFAVFASSQGKRDAFVTRLSATGAALGYSTYLGGNGDDLGNAVALACDTASASGPPACRAWVAGETTSATFPTTAGAFARVAGGGNDGFAARLDAGGSALEYATFLGGAGTDRALGVAVDPAGAAYVTGATTSVTLGTSTPVALGPRGGTDAFVAKLDASLTGSGSLVFLSTLGGGGTDVGYGIALRCGTAACEAVVAGETSSSDFPATADAAVPTYHGGVDGFVARLGATGAAVPYATFLGGSAADRAFAVTVDPTGLVSVAGETASSDFPTTPTAFDTAFGLLTDAFVVTLDVAPVATPTNTAPTATADSVATTAGATLVFAASDLAANDAAGEAGQTLTVTAVGSPSTAGGSVSLSGGNVTYVPPAAFTGGDTFTYTVCDSGTPPACATGTVAVTVSPVESRIDATDQTVEEGVLLAFTVTASGPSGGALAVGASDLPRGATFDPGTGGFRWTPTSAQAGLYFVRFTAGTDPVVTRAIRITVEDTILDGDLDDVPDAFNALVNRGPDNCPDVPNTDQSDIDGDGIGDVCDPAPNGFDAQVTASVVKVSPPASTAGHAENEPVVATVAVTFAPATTPTVACYLGVRPTPYDVVLEVLDAAGNVRLAERVQEGVSLVIALAPPGDLVPVCSAADPSIPGSVAGPQTLTADIPITDWYTLPAGLYVVRAHYVSVGVKDPDVDAAGQCTRGGAACYEPIWQGTATGSLTVTVGDQCPASGAGYGAGPGGTGCPVADQLAVTRKFTGAPVAGAQIRVFDRNAAAFRSVTGGQKNPPASLYPKIFEADAGRVGTCVTAANGVCFAGEEGVGDLLVIVKTLDSSGQVVYDGKPKSPSDFSRSTGIAAKDFQIP